MCMSDIPEQHFFLSSRSRWMKGARRIPFPSSELRKWSVSLLYVGRQRAAQNHNTSVCYIQKHRKGTHWTDHPSVLLRPRLCLLTHFTKWLRDCTITQRSKSSKKSQVKPELGCGITCSHLSHLCSQKGFRIMLVESYACLPSCANEGYNNCIW